MKKRKSTKSKRNSYIGGYILATVFLPIIPTLLSILFRLIVGYEVASKDLMLDTILIMASIVSSSIWGTYWSSKHISYSLRFVIMILQVCAMVFGYALYLGFFGFQLPDASIATPSQPTIICVLVSCGLLLLVNTIWDANREIKQQPQSEMQDSSMT